MIDNYMINYQIINLLEDIYNTYDINYLNNLEFDKLIKMIENLNKIKLKYDATIKKLLIIT